MSFTMYPDYGNLKKFLNGNPVETSVLPCNRPISAPCACRHAYRHPSHLKVPLKALKSGFLIPLQVAMKLFLNGWAEPSARLPPSVLFEPNATNHGRFPNGKLRGPREPRHMHVPGYERRTPVPLPLVQSVLNNSPHQVSCCTKGCSRPLLRRA